MARFVLLCLGLLCLATSLRLRQLPVPVPVSVVRKAIVTGALISLLFSHTDVAMGAVVEPQAPTDQDNQLVQVAFRDFDNRRFDASETEFTLALQKWKSLSRPRDEVVSLLRARANVFVDNKKFDRALRDINEAIEMMAVDGEKPDGTANYPEYVDAFVSRALSYEGLGEWGNALTDYNKAVSLWGGGRDENINPYVLTFRGNVLGKLNRWEESLVDFQAAGDIFLKEQNNDRFADTKANYALALYQLERTDESRKAMLEVIRRKPGYADMRIALAADSWARGDYIEALNSWRFACNEISVGCEAYKDQKWLVEVRRWPTSLAKALDQFQRREIPAKLLGSGVLAPSSKAE